jgi:DNA-nicking Smr family endonuclease
MNTPPLIDVHGLTKVDALHTLRMNIKFFYDQGFPEVTIVHGHGQGILKQAVRQFLGQVYFIKKIKSINNDGATVAIFKPN